MNWQDIVLMIITIGFGYSLVPQIFQSIKTKTVGINNQTSIITFIGLYISCIVYYSLELYFSLSMTFLTASCWLILFILKLRYRK